MKDYENKNYKNFKLIIKAKKVPIVNNPIIEYIEEKDRKSNHLYCEIYNDTVLISKGIILDFYKEFENIVDFFGNTSTSISQFEWQGKIYTKNTYFGQKIFEIKNFINPPIDKKRKEQYLSEIVNIFNHYLTSLINHGIYPIISYIPSSSKIPDDIAYNLSILNNLKLSHIIQKKSDLQSKSLASITSQSFDKYIVSLQNLDKSETFLIIDDVVGTGATFCEVMYKLYCFNRKINYFLAIVKDVKR